MKRSRFSDEQIIGILKEHQAGLSAAELCRRHGISDAIANAAPNRPDMPNTSLSGHDTRPYLWSRCASARSATSLRFHQPPPSAWKSIAVSTYRLACAWIRAM
jgi:hypothetical protein